MLHFGPDIGPVAVVALPLFEEANRCRAFAVTLCRALAERGLASVLPDLPGQGESLVPLEKVTLADFVAAIDAITLPHWQRGEPPIGIGVRSGAIPLDGAAFQRRWRLSPQGGHELLRDLKRIKQPARLPDKKLAEDWIFDPSSYDADETIEIAGNRIGAILLSDLHGRSARGNDDKDTRTIRLDTDPAEAERHVPGKRLWRRAEPDNDLALAALLADDIAHWIAACEG